MPVQEVIILAFSWFLIIAVWLPKVKHDYWIFRVTEYPRLQKFILILIVGIAYCFTMDLTNTYQLIVLILLSISWLYLGYKILPYTFFSKKEINTISSKKTDNQIKIFTANVYQYNTAYEKMLNQVKENNPDIVFFMETNHGWEKAMDALLPDYPNHLKIPLENTYGWLFYSKLEITDGAIHFLVDDEVPSLEANVSLPSGQKVKVWGLHPKPPVPGESMHSTAKDKEIIKVALRAKEEKELPMVVMGDLNDVAWSHVTELFTKTSGLMDPRKGRGFFSTFSAHHRFMRFPLDYVFCSASFGLINMKKLPPNGSDHFAMFIHFEYLPSLKQDQQKPKANREELEEAKEKASKAVPDES